VIIVHKIELVNSKGMLTPSDALIFCIQPFPVDIGVRGLGFKGLGFGFTINGSVSNRNDSDKIVNASNYGSTPSISADRKCDTFATTLQPRVNG